MDTLKANLMFSGKDNKAVNQNIAVVDKLSKCMAKMQNKTTKNVTWLVMTSNDEMQVRAFSFQLILKHVKPQ